MSKTRYYIVEKNDMNVVSKVEQTENENNNYSIRRAKCFHHLEPISSKV